VTPDPAREFARDERNQELTLVTPGPRAVFGLLWRVARLRCPRCGGGPVLQHWFKMRPTCGQCGGALEREEQDYFIGSMLLNLIIAELLFAGVFVGILVATWPDPPWTVLERFAPPAVLLAPLLLFPFSKLAWLGGDLLFRPDRGITPR
jgi:uncharacterized protein (DUF983 family)